MLKVDAWLYKNLVYPIKWCNAKITKTRYISLIVISCEREQDILFGIYIYVQYCIQEQAGGGPGQPDGVHGSGAEDVGQLLACPGDGHVQPGALLRHLQAALPGPQERLCNSYVRLPLVCL